MKHKLDAQFVFKMLLIYVMCQPFFDILSFMSIRNIIPIGISTYVKPLFVFITAIYIFFKFCKERKRWIIFCFSFCLFVIVHVLVLYNIEVGFGIILHEVRFLLNIAYMFALFFSFSTLVKSIKIDKKELIDEIKKTLFITMLLYCTVILIAVLTGTSDMTYEYADPNKLGYKGWLDSGQIFGHAFAICFPINLYVILSPKNSWYKKVLLLSIFLICVSLLGTKAPYYIVLAVLVIDLIISTIIKLFNKNHKFNFQNILILIVAIISMLLTYQYTPVAYNTNLNNQNGKRNLSSYDINKISGSSNFFDGKYEKGTEAYKYNEWNREASKYLIKLFESKKLHPSNMRKVQLNYFSYKYNLSDYKYKIFGLGYLNHNSNFSIESDLFMAFFCFGILGFGLILLLPITKFLNNTIFILRKLKYIDLEFYLIYMGIGIFFCISVLAGYTYIYTNFSIFLVLLFMILLLKQKVILENNLESIKINSKKISFLLLHLGYGGIETATINTANALSNEYDVEIVSLYNLKNNQTNSINSNVKIKYLTNLTPNRDEIKSSIKKFNIFKLIKEIFKATGILIQKRYFIIKEIKNTDAKYLVSTRVDFSTKLSKYGRNNTVKIAQEHHHHNDNKKYINKLKNEYQNIDYLCALTTALYDDYKKFLKNNEHTKVILLPNMLYTLPEIQSTLNTNNFITVGRLDKGKCVDEIVVNFSKIDNKKAQLYIIGDGAEYSNIKNLIDNLALNDRVHLMGYLNHNEIEKYMINSICFLMASATEGLPMVLLEAMSYGLPCIAYETYSGTKDIIDNDKNGYIIKNRNESEFIKKMNALLKNQNEIKKLSKNALLKANEFSAEEIIKKWKVILK